MSAPVFHTISDMFAAMVRGELAPGSEVACGHCPWMGVSTMFAPHLLACPDQSPTKVATE
jgi:hypothetical protein